MNKELIKIDYKNSDEYKSLVEDSQAILTEGIFRSRQELIDTYKILGERIFTDPLYKKWGQKTQGRFMRELAQDIGCCIPVLYFATQFYEKLITDKEFSTAVENLGKNASWNKIRAMLPDPKKEKTPDLPEGKYQVIYADPPWDYPLAKSRKRVDEHYPTMDLKELCDFGEKIKSISADNCTLFLWATSGRLDWAFPVLEAWGFKYKSSMVWDKVKYNMGYYSSIRHEFLLIAGKGKSTPTASGEIINSIDSVQSIEKSSKHSEKPDEFRKIIETLYPNTKKIELFARGKEKKGWTFWGNEI